VTQRKAPSGRYLTAWPSNRGKVALARIGPRGVAGNGRIGPGRAARSSRSAPHGMDLAGDARTTEARQDWRGKAGIATVARQGDSNPGVVWQVTRGNGLRGGACPGWARPPTSLR
jgi:hypothetical protein